MTSDEVIQKAYKMATGDDESILTSDSAWSKYLSLLNGFQKDWYNEKLTLPSERWLSMERESFSLLDLMAIPIVPEDIVLADNQFTMPEEAQELALYPLNGRKMMIVKDFGTDDEQVLKVLNGLNPQQYALRDENQPIYTYDYINKIVTVKPKIIEEARALGGCTIVWTYYKKLAELTTASDEVEVDDPNWLVYMLAAEIARPDIIQGGQYGNLVALAQNSMTSMVNRQRGMRIAEMNPWGIK